MAETVHARLAVTTGRDQTLRPVGTISGRAAELSWLFLAERCPILAHRHPLFQVLKPVEDSCVRIRDVGFVRAASDPKETAITALFLTSPALWLLGSCRRPHA